MNEHTADFAEIKASYPDSTAPSASVAVEFLLSVADRSQAIIAAISVQNSVRSNVYDTTELGDVESMRSFVAFNETQPANVYYCANRAVAKFQPPLPGRDEIDLVRMIVLDFDPARDKPLDEERDRLRLIAWNLEHGPLPPRAIVDTGGGMQVVYLLREPVPVHNGNRKAVTEDIESLMKALARAHGADTATCTIKNLFRIPGTTNWPTDAKKKAGRTKTYSGIWLKDGPRTAIEDLRALCVLEPSDIAGGAAVVDFEGITEHDMIEVLGEPGKLPVHIIDLLANHKVLAEEVRLPDVHKDDTSGQDNRLLITLARHRMPPRDMALVVCAYGAKVHKMFRDERLFSYVVGSVRKAVWECSPLRFFTDFELRADEQAERRIRESYDDMLRPLTVEEFLKLYENEEPYLVQGLMPTAGTTVVYGKSGSGKTFVVLDLAYRISLGLEWHSKKTIKSGVIYVAAEATRSLMNRVKALHDKYGHSPDFRIVRRPVDMFSDKAEINKVLRHIERMGMKVGLVVFDTLARVMHGGNENSTQDMSRLVMHGDQIRDHLQCNVLWIHHTGKDESLGARGSSALRAATDAEIEVGAGKFKVTKLRDDEPFECAFKLKPVLMGKDAEGAEVTTCTVEWLGVPSMKVNQTPAERNRDYVLHILRQIGEPATVTEIRAMAEQLGIKLMTRQALMSMLNRSCESSTERFFTRYEERTGKQIEIRYGLFNE